MTKGVPSSAVFHRSQAKSYATASGGEGVYLKTKDGKLILDGSSGAAVSCLGHGHQRVIQAIIDQAQRMAFAHSSFFTSDPAEELATLLLGQSQGAFTKVMLLSSGQSSSKTG